jgi:hypothetical protein
MPSPGSAAQQLESLDRRVRVLEEEVAWLREASAKTEASGAMASASTPPAGVPRVELAAPDVTVVEMGEAPIAAGAESALREVSPQPSAELANLRAEVELLGCQNRAQSAELALMRVLAAPQTEVLEGLDDLLESDLRRWPREAREKLQELAGLVGRLRLRIAAMPGWNERTP